MIWIPVNAYRRYSSRGPESLSGPGAGAERSRGLNRVTAWEIR